MVFDKLTEHFDWAEVTRSDTASRMGIDNSLPSALLPTVQKTATKLERVRERPLILMHLPMDLLKIYAYEFWLVKRLSSGIN